MLAPIVFCESQLLQEVGQHVRSSDLLSSTVAGWLKGKIAG